MSTRKPRRWLRRAGKAFAGLLLLLVLAWVFRFPLFGGLIRGAIATALEPAGIRLEVGEISGSLLFDAEIRDLRVVSATGVPQILSAEVDRVSVSYSILGLLRGDAEWLGEIELEGVRAEIDGWVPPN